MSARPRHGKLLCRIPIASLATAAGAGTVATIAALAEEQRDLSIPIAAGTLVALFLGALQIAFCSGNGRLFPTTEQEQADIGKNRPAGLPVSPAADPMEKGPQHG